MKWREIKMSVYKILFTPLEEYFFGDEGSFTSKIEESKYFLISKDMPSQTTVFGLMRYMGLKHVKGDFDYTFLEKKENEEHIGKYAFDMEKATENCFENTYGKIKRMSSVFIHENNGGISRIYVSLPKDASNEMKENEENKKQGDDRKNYTSILKDKLTTIKTGNGNKLLPENFNHKKGILNGYISIDGGYCYKNKEIREENGNGNKILTEIFRSIKRSNIRIYDEEEREKNDKMSSLFKREYKNFHNNLEGKFSFGVFLETDFEDDFVKENFNRIIGMGLGNKKFKVTAEKTDEIEKKARLNEDFILKVDKIFKNHPQKDKLIYFISPTYIKDSNKIIEDSLFSSISTTTNRPQKRKEDNTISKIKELYRMIEAGSIILVEDSEKFLREIDSCAMKKIGYNHFYIGGKKNEC